MAFLLTAAACRSSRPQQPLLPDWTLTQPAEDTRLTAPAPVERQGSLPHSQLLSPIPRYDQAPVFYEKAWQYYGAAENVELARQGELDIGVMGRISLQKFSWHEKGKSDSYWVAMENFRYLLPLVASDRPEDETFVRAWFVEWLNNHGAKPLNYGASDAMSVAHRAMTFVWYLRKQHLAGRPEDDLSARLRQALLQDQAFLRDNYRPVSNHGFWEAMGLLETTRVHPDSGLSLLALDRLLYITRLSVSAQGLHMEHSPAYHFWVMNWVRQFADYLVNMEGLQWSGTEEMVRNAHHMFVAGYFLYDHAHQLAQIGDSDATVLEPTDVLPADQVPSDPVLFDPEAGYSAFKDKTRLVLFTTQNRTFSQILPYHYHDDALAVYYADHGEILLGDSGRYSYGHDKVRNHCASIHAHNSLFSPGLGRGRLYAVDVKAYEEDSRVTFQASTPAAAATRTVSIPKKAERLEVLDEIDTAGDWRLLWHLGQDVQSISERRTEELPDSATILHSWTLETRSGRKHTLRIAVPRSCLHDVGVLKGSDNPYLGWYSPSQGVVVPSSVVQLRLKADNPVRVITVVQAER